MPKLAIPPLTREAAPDHPVLGASPGPYAHAVPGEPGGLTQFGVHLGVLPPGSRSGCRHWHEAGDEVIWMISGAVWLIEDTDARHGPGDAAAWPGGPPVGHCLENRGPAEAVYLVVGTRRGADDVHYPDAGVTLTRGGGHRRFTDAAGTLRHETGA
jgi:uncharacterized cupin superfamily protein